MSTGDVSASSVDRWTVDVVRLDADLAAGLGPVDDDGLIRLGDAGDGEYGVQNRTPRESSTPER